MDDYGWIDIETFSRYDLKEVGADVYSRNCEIILASYAYGLEDVSLWEIGQNPAEVKEMLALSKINIAHNVWFEFNVFKHTGWCTRPVSDWHCTMAQAHAHSLPAGLDMLCRAMGLPQHLCKLTDGTKLIRLFCKPQRNGKQVTKIDLPDEWEQFRQYAIRDIVAMRENYMRMPRINLDACC